MARTKIVTPEEKRQSSLSHKMFGFEFTPEPTYYFRIGNSVSIGNLRNCIIVDVLEDGKLYEVEYSTVKNEGETASYRKEEWTHGQRGFWKWFEIRPFRSLVDNEIIKNDDLRLHYSQRQIEGILNIKYSFGLELDPPYQRGYVWSQEDNIALIDSVFLNIDIGKFVFVHREYSNKYLYEILDGKQRMNALLSYYENRFSYKGLFYNDLSKHEQYHFDNYPVSYAELQDATEEQKIRYFLKLNRTGKVMDQKHLAKIEKMLE